ncbi:MAG: zinc ribbon domain-containing protein [Chloroflexi bacterium]|nr:zinc ribbon domain-containing protein [Chloroflexota bacterium]
MTRTISSMPIHEYRCLNCRRKVSIFYRSLSQVDHAQARCDRCGGSQLTRLVSRVRVMRGGGTEQLGTAGDVDESLLGEMDGVDENDPRSLGRFMRRMAEETGEDVGPEFNEIIGRLERGEDPERIEQDMGDILGDEPSAGTDEPAAIEAEPTPKPKPARHRKTAATKSGVKKTTKKKK